MDIRLEICLLATTFPSRPPPGLGYLPAGLCAPGRAVPGGGGWTSQWFQIRLCRLSQECRAETAGGSPRPSPTASPTSCLCSQEPQLEAENLASATLPSTSLLDLRPQADRAPLTKAGLSSLFLGWSLPELYWRWKEHPHLPTSRHFSTNPPKALLQQDARGWCSQSFAPMGPGPVTPEKPPAPESDPDLPTAHRGLHALRPAASGVYFHIIKWNLLQIG